MRLKLCSCTSLRARYTRGHSVTSKIVSTFGVAQYTKVLPSTGSTMTKCLGSSGLGGLKALQPLMLVIVEHAEQAQALVVKCTGHGHGIDGPVDHKERCPSGLRHLLAVGDNNLRHMHIGRIIRDKERLARFIMGDDGLGAGHDAAQHRDLALV